MDGFLPGSQLDHDISRVQKYYSETAQTVSREITSTLPGDCRMSKPDVSEKQAVTTEAKLVALAGNRDQNDGWHWQLMDAIGQTNVATLAARMEEEKVGTVIRDNKGEVKELVFDGPSDKQHDGEIAIEIGAAGAKTVLVRDASAHPVSIIYPDGQSREMQYDSQGALISLQDTNGRVYNRVSDLDLQRYQQSERAQRSTSNLYSRKSQHSPDSPIPEYSSRDNDSPLFRFGGRSGWDNISVEKNGDITLQVGSRHSAEGNIEGRTIQDFHDGSSAIEYAGSGSRLELHPADSDGTVHGEGTGSKPHDQYSYTHYADGSIRIDYMDGRSGFSIDQSGIKSWGPKTDDNFHMDNEFSSDPPRRLTQAGKVADSMDEVGYAAFEVLNVLNPFGESLHEANESVRVMKSNNAFDTYRSQIAPITSAAEQLSEHIKGKNRERTRDDSPVLKSLPDRIRSTYRFQ
jgi:YD repeat-containing protein